MKKIFILFLLFGGGLVRAEQSNNEEVMSDLERTREYKKIQEKVQKITPEIAIEEKAALSKFYETQKEFRKVAKELREAKKKFYDVVLGECNRGLTFTKDECILIRTMFYDLKNQK